MHAYLVLKYCAFLVLSCRAMVRYTYIVKSLVLQSNADSFSREWIRYGSTGYRTEMDAWNAITDTWWQYAIDSNLRVDPNYNHREVIAFDVIKSIAFNWA